MMLTNWDKYTYIHIYLPTLNHTLYSFFEGEGTKIKVLCLSKLNNFDLSLVFTFLEIFLVTYTNTNLTGSASSFTKLSPSRSKARLTDFIFC